MLDKIKFKRKSSNELPFKVNAKMGVNTSKTKPFYVEFKITYSDRNFKKLMSNVIKEEKYLLEYEFTRENKGSLFSPRYESVIEANIRKMLRRDHAIMLSVASLGLLNDTADGDNSVLISSLIRDKVFFKEADESRLFTNKAQSLLVDLLQFHYDEYERVKNIPFESYSVD